MRTYWDNGIWSELADRPRDIGPLIELVRRRRIQVLLSPTVLAEMHGIGPGHDELYALRDRTARALGWDRVLRDAQELVTIAFVRYAARFLGGAFAQKASGIDGSLLTHDRLSDLPAFSYNTPLKQELDAAKARNLASARKVKHDCATNTDDTLTNRVDLFRSNIQTEGAAALLARLEGMPRDQKLCPFILSLRDGQTDLKTQIQASDILMLHKMVADLRELPSLPSQPWDNPASNLLKEHAGSFNDEFWRGLHRVNDDPYLFRQRTHSFIIHYLIANGFSGEDGSFWHDAQNVVYAHDVHMFVTTDKRMTRGLRTDYMREHLRTFGRAPTIVYLPPRSDIPSELVQLLRT